MIMKTRKKSLLVLCAVLTISMCSQGIAFAAESKGGNDSSLPQSTVTESGDGTEGVVSSGSAGSEEEQLSFEGCQWQEEIDEMLDAGDYVKGQVVAGVEPGAVSEAGENAVSKSDQLIAKGEKLMDTTAASEDMQIIRIKSRSMTTEQILETLKNDQRVIFAEPNYVTEKESLQDSKTTGTKATGEKNSASNIGSATAKPYDVTVDDATPLQWANFRGADLKLSEKIDPSVHVPGFGPTGSNMKKSAIAAVIDMPIDFNHPDLKKTAYTFTPKQQKKLKCGKYGYNATRKDGKLEFFDECNHGMHCAGILGASWDGKGISGVASKAKIMSVQILDATGNTSLVDDLRAFDFVKRAKKSGIDIRVTSNSWGIIQSSKAVNAAVYELGKKYGIVSVFAAGNDAKENMNANEMSWTLDQNPYVVVVSSTDMNNQLAYYSSYGVAESTLGSPGSFILSSIIEGSSQYIPDMTKDSNKFYEGFDEGESKVTIRQVDEKGNPVGSPAVKNQPGEATFYGKGAMKIDVDKKYYKMTEENKPMCCIELDLGDVSDKGIVPEKDYLRLSTAGKKEISCFNCGFTIGGKTNTEVMLGGNEGTVSWASPYCELPKGIDTKNLKIKIFVEMNKMENNTIYIDSIGIGSQHVPYAFFDGTSMAAPQVAGAATVLAGNNSKLRGKALAQKITQMTRPNKNLKGKTKTGGVLDFESKASATGKVHNGPLITSLKIKGKTVTIKGKGFGKKKGSVRIYRFVTGKKDGKRKGKITKWSSGKVTIKLSKKFKGIMKVILAAKTGRTFTYHKFISKSKNLYSKEERISKKTGSPFKVDAQGDYETNGPMKGLKGKLYYLPKVTRTEEMPACKKFLRYDTKKKKWQRLPDIPQWLENVSMTVYKGKLVVKGTRMEKAFDGSPVSIEILRNSNSRIYVFDPKKYKKLKKGKKKKAWKKASHKNVKLTATIFTRKGKLMLAGGCDYKVMPKPGQKFPENTSDLVKYSLKKGAGKRIRKFENLVNNPSVAVKGNRICVYNYNRYELFMVNGSKIKKLKNALPKYVMTGEDRGNLVSITEREGVVVAAPKGFMLVGPAAKSGSSDTFLLKSGSKKFKACKRRASDARVIAPAAAAYKGRLYVIGSSALEKGHRFFRSTKM